MLIPKRTIPRVGVAALVLGGCGDDEVDSPAEVAAAVCRFEQRCDPEDFSYEYASLAECETELRAEVDAYTEAFRTAYGDACADAFTAYYRCIAQDYADQNGENTCLDTAEIACSPEYSRFATECPLDEL